MPYPDADAIALQWVRDSIQFAATIRHVYPHQREPIIICCATALLPGFSFLPDLAAAKAQNDNSLLEPVA